MSSNAPVGTPARFLHSFAQALSAMLLYTPGHPARERVVDAAFESLATLQRTLPVVRISFLEGDVILDEEVLHEFRNWAWARRLSRLGVQRIEFGAAVQRDSFGVFLDTLLARLTAHDPLQSTLSWPGIACGAVRLRDEDVTVTGRHSGTVSMPYRLGDEAETVQWIFAESAAGRPLPRPEVETVVRSLTVAMHAEGQLMVPLLQLQRMDQYVAMHAVNVSVLAMTLAETLGLSGTDIRAFGRAGLLHDIGMTRVPAELLTVGMLTREERQRIEQHPLDGARMLMQSGPEFDLAAAAAYEHHVRPDGSGYPELRPGHEPHYVSRIVAVCDAYDALRSPRSYRPAWSPEQAVQHIEDGAGGVFDRGVAKSFSAMIRRLEDRLVRVRPDPADVQPAGETASPGATRTA